jgi:putative transposase
VHAYAQRGGYTPAEQRRERLRLQAAERFARGDAVSEIARDLRVTEGSARQARARWFHQHTRFSREYALVS